MNLESWRDAALILLVVESFVLNLAPLAICYFALKGVIALQKKLRPLLTRAQGYARQADRGVSKGTSFLARPAIWLRSNAAGVRRTWNVYNEGR